jgi:hypothetical protein
LPIGQIFNVNSAEFSSTDLSVNFWQRLHQLVPVTDGQMDQVEKDIFANLTSRAELASNDINQPSGDYRNSELFAWICSGIVSMKALFPPFVDPVQEQQTTRDSLQYQVGLGARKSGLTFRTCHFSAVLWAVAFYIQ